MSKPASSPVPPGFHTIGHVRDPFGVNWAIASHKEEVTPEEMQERAAAAFGGGPA